MDLKLARRKTKVLLVAKEPAEVVIKIDDYKLEQVIRFKYLGTEVTDQNISITDLRCRTVETLAAAGNPRVFRHHLAGAYYKCRDFLPHIQVHRIFR